MSFQVFLQLGTSSKVSFLILQVDNRLICSKSPHAIVLAGIELIFLTVASTSLCFGSVLKIVLIMQGCFSCCQVVLTLVKDFSSAHVEEAWEAQEAGRGHSQDS